VAKPAIVSRTGWGCPEGQGSPRWSPAYSTVTHIIIHHAATTNNAVDWATEVYNVWNYHANIRDGGWGDIGYNYLIDPNGVIYEGRAGGDDVVAGHVLDHNRGTMGVAFLGTFSTIEPTSSALRSAAALIAWKCAQKNIDPLGSGTDFAGTYYSYVAGHRDLAATECPGSKLYDLLPTLRQSVSNAVTNSLGSSTPKFETGFFAEVKKQKQLIIDSIGALTDENTEVIPVGENMIFPDHTYWNWLKLPPGWETIRFSETDVDQAQRYMDIHGWSYMVTFATNHGAPIGDRYITITNKEMWNMVDGNVEGWSNWGPTVIAEDSAASSDYTVLHELGHSWGLLDEYRYTTWYNEASSLLWHPHYGYDNYAIWLLTGHPPNSYPEDTPGTDTSNGYLFDSKRCIMGPANPWTPGRGFCPPHQWDDPNRDEWGAPRSYEGCSAHVEETTKNDIGVSTAGLVSAIITFYGNQSMRPTIQEITGFPIVGKSMQYSGPSNYSIQVFAEEGELIYNSNISLSFTSAFSQYLPGLHVGITSDFVTIHWLLPMFSETTVTVALRDNVENQVIATQAVTIVPTAEAWIDYRTTDKAIYDFGETIEVTTEINTTLPSMDVVLDVSLLDPNSIVQDYKAWIGTIYPTADPIKLYLNVPNSGTAGTWAVYVAVLNSTGQLQDSKRNFITVGADAIPPTTALTIGSPKYTDIGGNVYVTSSTSFSLLATDNLGGSGVASTAYKIRNATYDSGWLTYAAAFCLTEPADGNYFIDYNSTDNVGNTELTNTATVILDNTPPTTTLTIGEPKYISEKTYVTPDTPFTLEAADTGSGVYSTAYRICNSTYDSGWITYAGPVYLTSLTSGTYTIEYNSTDNVQNTETTHTTSVTLFHWNYIYQDTHGRGTTLKINLAHKFLQFTAPSKDYGIRKATSMRQCGRAIIINHCDKQLRLITVSVDTKTDFCFAMAWDLQTRKCYLLIDKAGIE
jgi:hypothetical protein